MPLIDLYKEYQFFFLLLNVEIFDYVITFFTSGLKWNAASAGPAGNVVIMIMLYSITSHEMIDCGLYARKKDKQMIKFERETCLSVYNAEPKLCITFYSLEICIKS